MMNDGVGFFIGGLIGFVIGLATVIISIKDNPIWLGRWECTDWQIVNYKPECRVMTKIGEQ